MKFFQIHNLIYFESKGKCFLRYSQSFFTFSFVSQNLLLYLQAEVTANMKLNPLKMIADDIETDE